MKPKMKTEKMTVLGGTVTELRTEKPKYVDDPGHKGIKREYTMPIRKPSAVAFCQVAAQDDSASFQFSFSARIV